MRRSSDEFVRSLFDGEPDDPAPGEPRPGLRLAHDWVAEEKARLVDPHGYLDMLWAHGPYVESFDLAVKESSVSPAVCGSKLCT